MFNEPDLSSLTGTFAPSTKAERVWSPMEPIPFNCSYAIANDIFAICETEHPYHLNIHALGNRAGGLISQFAKVTDPETPQSWAQEYDNAFISWGTPLLVLNVSSSWVHMNPYIHYPEVYYSATMNYTMQNDATLQLQENGIWTEILTNRGPANLSVSLCYAAWDTSRQRIDMHSDTIRSEPTAHWWPGRTDTSPDNSDRAGVLDAIPLPGRLYTTPDINDQFGHTQVRDAASRGILDLGPKDSWIPEPEDGTPISVQPFVQMFGSIEFVFSAGYTSRMLGNWSTIFCTDLAVASQVCNTVMISAIQHSLTAKQPDPTLLYLFKSFLDSSGSLARSISSLITILSSMAYYDQMPQFQTSDNTTQVFFTEAVYPRSRQGFWTIITLLLVHVALVLTILVGFALFSKFTLLGNSWQSVAQLWSLETRDLILTSSMTSDKEVKDHLRAAGMQDTRVGVETLTEEPRIGLVSK